MENFTVASEKGLRFNVVLACPSVMEGAVWSASWFAGTVRGDTAAALHLAHLRRQSEHPNHFPFLHLFQTPTTKSTHLPQTPVFAILRDCVPLNQTAGMSATHTRMRVLMLMSRNCPFRCQPEGCRPSPSLVSAPSHIPMARLSRTELRAF